MIDYEEEWGKLKSKLKIGDIIEGKVVKHQPFGFFVNLNEKFLGLVEIITFKESPMEMKDFPKIGIKIKCKILYFYESPTEENKWYQIRLKYIESVND